MGSSLSALTGTRGNKEAPNTSIRSGTLNHPTFMEDIAKVMRKEPGATHTVMGLIQQYYNEGKIEEIHQKVQQLKQDTVKLEGEYIALREELEIEDKNTEDLDKAFIKRIIECDKHALEINERYVKDRLDCINFLGDILHKEDPETDDVDIQAAFALQKELREKEGDIRKRLHVPFPVALFPELDKDTPFMVSMIRGVPEEQQERYLLTVLKWSRAARKHKEVA